MSVEKKFHIVFALVLGFILAVAGSVWATSLGNAVSVTGALSATGATTLSGLLTANGGISIGANALTGTTGLIDYTNFDVDASGNTTVGGTLTVTGTITSNAATTFNSTATIGTSGTALTQVKTGYVSCGPNVVNATIAATTTGTLMCSSGFSGINLLDKVFMTATTTAAINNGEVVYAGKASTTASNQVQVDVINLTGAVWNVTTSTWHYLIIR